MYHNPEPLIERGFFWVIPLASINGKGLSKINLGKNARVGQIMVNGYFKIFTNNKNMSHIIWY